MTPVKRAWYQHVGLCIGLGLLGGLLAADTAKAQIIPDATLGTEQSIVAPNPSIRGLPADTIRGGATRGVNLFHSFSQFNIIEGQRVYFANPAGIANILSRVTGTDPSRILGTLGVDGQANLFLINPNGILFGPNARLDVAGSFLASTANSFQFPDGSEFSAVNPQAAPLLTINIRPGLQYGANHHATIRNTGNLAAGNDLTLAAGNLDLEGQLQAGGDLTLRALDTVKVRDSVTAPFIAASGGKLTVQGDRAVDIFALNHPNSRFFSGSDMVLRSANTVSGDAHYYAGGSFRIETLEGNPGNLFSPYDPVILASGDVFLNNYTGESLHILAGGNVFIAGDVDITGPGGFDTTINLNNPNPLLAFLSGTPFGNIDGSAASVLDIRAGVDWAALGVLFPDLLIDPLGRVNGFATPAPTGSSITVLGTISNGSPTAINGPNGPTYLTNNYLPNPRLLPGNIEIGRSIGTFGNVVIDSRGGIVTGFPANPGLGGIDTSLASSDSGVNGLRGVAGTIALIAEGSINTTRGKLNSIVGTIDQTTGAIALENGRAGDIILISKNGRIDTAEITTSVREGQSGDILLEARGDINTFGNITSFAQTDPTIGLDSNGGNITLTSRSGSINTSGGYVNTTTGSGRSGDITITAFGNIITGVDPSPTVPAIGAYVSANGIGVAGNITLTSVAGGIDTSAGTINSASPAIGISGNIALRANGPIFAGNIDSSSAAPAQAGDIELTSNSDIFVVNRQIQSRTFGNGGRAGDIRVRARSLVLANEAGIITSTQGRGDAGDILIQADDTVLLDNNSQIRALVEAGAVGRAGDVDIRARSLQVYGSQIGSALFREFRTPEGLLLIQGAQGAGGTVRVNATESVILSGTNADGFASGIIALTERGAGGPAGNVEVNTGLLRIDNGAGIAASTRNFGQGGDVVIRANTLEIFSGGRIQANSDDIGIGGSIDITADRVNIVGLDSNYFLRRERIEQYLDRPLVDIFPAITPRQAGDTVDDVFGGIVSPFSGVFASTRGFGPAGDIRLRAGTINIADIGTISADTGGAFAGGNIDVQTQFLTLSGGGNINASTFGSGKGGDIFIRPLNSALPSSITLSGTAPFPFLPLTVTNLAQLILVDGIAVGGFSSGIVANSEDGASGSGGAITLNTTTLSIADGAVVSARTREAGRGGDIALNVVDLNLIGGGQVITPTFGSGAAGNIGINATGTITISGFDPTFLFRFGQVQEAWQTLINVGFVSPDFDALKLARFTVDPIDPASGLRTTVEPEAIANFSNLDIGGNIEVRTRSLEMSNFGVIGAGTSGLGNAGQITIQASEAITMSGNSSIRGTVEQGGIGDGGNIDVRGRSLTLNSGAQIQSGVFREGNGRLGGRGNAGNIQILTAEDVTIAGEGTDASGETTSSGIFVSTEPGARGSAGSIVVETGALQIRDRGLVNASTFNEFNAGNIIFRVAGNIVLDNQGTVAVSGLSTGNPGNIEITTGGSLALRRQSSIQAVTNSGKNANIAINARGAVVLSEQNNQITAEAFGQLGDGGNISISALAVLTFLANNNDIVANATFSEGGKIFITSPFFTGNTRQGRQTGNLLNKGSVAVFRQGKIRTPESDITASSEFGVDGIVEVRGQEQLEATPPLPALRDVTGLITIGCGYGDKARSRFVTTGRGGVVPSPFDPLQDQTVTSDWVTTDDRNVSTTGDRTQANPPNEMPASAAIVEAQGFRQAPDGAVFLIADAATVTPQPSWHPGLSCESPQSNRP